MSLKLSLEKQYFIKLRKSEGKNRGTLNRYELAFRRFSEFLAIEEIDDLRSVDRKVAERFISYILKLKHYRTKKQLSRSSMVCILSGVRQLYMTMFLDEKILENPFEKLHIKSKENLLPRDILAEDEILKLFEGLKDRYGLFGETIGELFYGTGLRASELVNLTIKDVNLRDNILFVRDGKGKKDRVLPIPFGVSELCRKYKKIVKPKKNFFESTPGRGVSSNWIRKMLHQAAKDVGITKRVTPHSLRHTFATHLISRGMDIRYIQALLGHEEITTTEIYTRINNKELIKAYRLSHPRA